MYSWWQDIDSGDPARIKSASQSFAEEEQVRILRPGYTKIKSVELNPVPAGIVAKEMSDKATSGLAGVQSFRQFSATGSIADTNLNVTQNQRWLWVKNHVMAKWNTLTEAQRTQIVESAIDKINSAQQLAQRNTPAPYWLINW